MLIAVAVIVAVLFIFIVTSYFLTCKTYTLDVEGSKVLVQNRGSHLRIYVDGTLVDDYINPQIIYGETFKLQINNKEVNLKCQCSSLGFKFRVEADVDGKVVCDNGVVLKKKDAKRKEAKEKEIDKKEEEKVTIIDDKQKK